MNPLSRALIHNSGPTVVLGYALWFGAAWATPQPAPQGSEPPDIDSLIELESPRDSVISPNGDYVVYVVESTNWEDDRYDRHLMLAPADSSQAPMRLTREDGSSHRPRFYPDSRSVAFLSDRNGEPQVFRLSLDGGDAEQLTRRPSGVRSFEIASDSSIVFTSIDEPDSAHETRQERYGELVWVDEDLLMNRLYHMPLLTGVTRRPMTARCGN